MPSIRLTNIRNKIAAKNTSVDSQNVTKKSANDLHSATGFEPGPPELRRSQRLWKRSSKGAYWDNEQTQTQIRSNRNRRTRARKLKAKQAQLHPSRRSSGSPDPLSLTSGDETMSEEHTQDLPGNGTQSQVWETVTFIPFSTRTRAAQEMDDWFGDRQAPSAAPARQEAAYNVLPGVPLGTGAGFHHDHPAERDSGLVVERRQPPTQSTTSKRPLDQPRSDPPKRARIPDDSDTATESEEELPIPGPLDVDVPMDDAAPAAPSAPQSPAPLPVRPMSPSTRMSIIPETPKPASPALLSVSLSPLEPEHQPEDAPDPSGGATPQDETRTSSHSLGGSYTPESRPSTERLYNTGYGTPPKSPSRRQRLRELAKKELAKKTRLSLPGGLMNDMPAYIRALSTNPQLRLAPPGRNDASPQQPGPQPPCDNTSHPHTPGNVQTYSGSRSHHRSESHPSTSGSQHPNCNPQPSARSQPASRLSTASISGVQPNASSPQASTSCVNDGRQGGLSRSTLQPSMPLHARSHHAASGSHLGSGSKHQRGGSRLDPTSRACADMAAYNQGQLNKRASMLVESVTHNVQGVPTTPMQPEEILPDDAEVRAQAIAIAKGKRPAHRRRKQKPLARDTVGVARHVLALAKLHLFALALVECIYPTRGLALHWASIVYEETWCVELPDVPFEEPTESQLEVLVNNIPTLRGVVKNSVRRTVEGGYKFTNPAESDMEMGRNLEIYVELSGGGFHCLFHHPRSGHYQNPVLKHAIGAAFFGSAGSVGRVYPEYFEEMELPIVAFILAMMEFCVEEWSNGWLQTKDLNTGRMSARYAVHKKNLENAKKVFPGRLRDLRKEWFAYCLKLMTSPSPTEQPTAGVIPVEEFRPDTPEPEPEYDENGRLTARCKGKGRARD